MLGDVSEVGGGQMRGAEGDFQVVACAPGRTELDRGRSETGDGGGTNDGRCSEAAGPRVESSGEAPAGDRT